MREVIDKAYARGSDDEGGAAQGPKAPEDLGLPQTQVRLAYIRPHSMGRQAARRAEVKGVSHEIYCKAVRCLQKPPGLIPFRIYLIAAVTF